MEYYSQELCLPMQAGLWSQSKTQWCSNSIIEEGHICIFVFKGEARVLIGGEVYYSGCLTHFFKIRLTLKLINRAENEYNYEYAHLS